MRLNKQAIATPTILVHETQTSLFQPSATLDEHEQEELGNCESIITQGLTTYFLVGQALQKIRNERLYRANFSSFEAYCREKWDFSRMHATRLIRATEVRELLLSSPNLPLPENESQIRPLTKIPIQDVAKVWKHVRKEAGNGKITAKLVSDVIRRKGQASEPKPTGRTKMVWQMQADGILEKIKSAVAEADFNSALGQMERLKVTLEVERDRPIVEVGI